MCRVKGRERNRKKSHLLLLDPNLIHIMPFLFKKKGRGKRKRREMGSRWEGRVMKGESGRGEEKGRRGREGCLTGL